MNNDFLLRWFALPEKLRWLSLLGLLLGLALIVHWLSITPARAQQQQARREAAQQRQQYQRQLTPLLRQPGLQSLELRNQQRLKEMVRDGEPFSLYTLLRRSGGELEQWRPGARESQLQLWLNWQQLKQLFAYLIACEPAPALTAFTVRRKDARLQATFHLAFDDEISRD
ncbi:MAG: hypothetical protein E6X23_09545 [Mixta calida]|uniref:DNA utilization protein HofO C-terminal domain-containing protein n=1 Tax=Mixta calida TaxID=665913 RepID=A0ABN5H7Y0_9GAMM|nr:MULTISPECIES: hypothetical protein [Mixta]MBS6058971.1 hypothetical protein [Pantoea sp.]POU50623.1 hypothetical protein C3380_05050 [Pantoea sp. PSNIH5]POU69176.1 hypothetical protein C3374_06390 [Pantoea sp. PSNIH4]POY69173.1 hypothetical protein C3402_03600 [Pantoea sp. PSNIH3]AUY23780.1 hypothetical protein C2E16_01875 [Mixta calida]